LAVQRYQKAAMLKGDKAGADASADAWDDDKGRVKNEVIPDPVPVLPELRALGAGSFFGGYAR
jgi:hypothetical protein